MTFTLGSFHAIGLEGFRFNTDLNRSEGREQHLPLDRKSNLSNAKMAQSYAAPHERRAAQNSFFTSTRSDHKSSAPG